MNNLTNSQLLVSYATTYHTFHEMRRLRDDLAKNQYQSGDFIASEQAILNLNKSLIEVENRLNNLTNELLGRMKP